LNGYEKLRTEIYKIVILDVQDVFESYGMLGQGYFGTLKSLFTPLRTEGSPSAKIAVQLNGNQASDTLVPLANFGRLPYRPIHPIPSPSPFPWGTLETESASRGAAKTDAASAFGIRDAYYLKCKKSQI